VIVVDASALVDFLLGRPEAVEAVLDATAKREHEPLHAPEVIEPETLNALRRLVAGGAVTERRAAEAVADLAAARLIRYPHAPLRARIWALRDQLTAYDAAYVALAEAMPDPLLLTGDGGLAGRARDALGAAGVRHIAQ
jgi:predicted nucleic acid-binding protein